MNITYIIGVVAAFAVMVIGMMQGGDGGFLTPKQIMNFVDGASVFITIGCTFAVLVASFPPAALKDIPKHFKVLMNTKKYDPLAVIDRLVELAQVARKNGLLALEEMGNQEQDPFFKQCIMLIVDNNDADQAKEIMMNDIEQSSARHEDAAGMYDKASSVAPAFGMVGTLVGLINMLKGMDVSAEGGASNIGTAMGTALITTLYGCVLAHMIFGPIATQLRLQAYHCGGHHVHSVRRQPQVPAGEAAHIPQSEAARRRRRRQEGKEGRISPLCMELR